MTKLLSLTAAALLAASTAQAALVVDVSGTPGSGQTTWTFSGVAIAQRNGAFESSNVFSFNNIWGDLGAFTDVGFLISDDDISGDAALNVDNAIVPIDSLFAGDEVGDPTKNGAFAVGIGGIIDLIFSPGSTIVWSGSLTAQGLDINDFNTNGAPTSFFSTSTFGLTENTLDLQLNITPDEISAVPLPAGGMLLLSGLTGIAAMRRRKKVAR